MYCFIFCYVRFNFLKCSLQTATIGKRVENSSQSRYSITLFDDYISGGNGAHGELLRMHSRGGTDALLPVGIFHVDVSRGFSSVSQICSCLGYLFSRPLSQREVS
jgi:hypothetical protein